MFSIFTLAIKFDCLFLAIFQSFHLLARFIFGKLAFPLQIYVSKNICQYSKDMYQYPLYFNILSNHHPAITKHLPLMIEKRISQISCDESEFHRAVRIYEQALQKSGYDVKLSFQQQPALGRERKRNRKRNIIWFNPPYNEQVKTNIGKSFFHLLK